MEHTTKEIPKEIQVTATFDDDFQDILDELKKMKPEPNAGKNSNRWKWVKGDIAEKDDADHAKKDYMKRRYTEFILTIRKAYNFDEAEKTSKAQETSIPLYQDAGMAIRGKKEIDDECLMLAVIDTVNSWKGEEDGSFIRIVLNKYKQYAGASVGKTILSSHGRTTSYDSESSLYRIRIAVAVIRKAMKIDGSKDARTLMEELSAEGNIKELDISDELKEEVIAYLDGQRNIVYLDAPAGEEFDASIGDSIPDEKQAHVFDRERMNSIFSDFESKWEIIRAGTDKEKLNKCKALFSRDILVQLKLCKLNRQIAKEAYPDDLEPECKRWCPYSDSCKLGKSNRQCYVRFDRMIRKQYPEEKEPGVLQLPAGDPEVYNMLAVDEKEVYDFLLNNTYVRNAFIKEPQDLKDIYANVLKDFKGPAGERFRFTDDGIVEALELRDNSYITRAKKDYVGMVHFLYELSQKEL